MAATTFTRFGELPRVFPRELQIQIWEFAAIPNKKFDKEWDLEYELQQYSQPFCSISALFLQVILCPNYGMPQNILVLKEACLLRRTMRATCRLAKQVALEVWRKDVVFADEELALFDTLESHFNDEVRGVLLSHLDTFIEYVLLDVGTAQDLLLHNVNMDDDDGEEDVEYWDDEEEENDDDEEGGGYWDDDDEEDEDEDEDEDDDDTMG